MCRFIALQLENLKLQMLLANQVQEGKRGGWCSMCEHVLLESIKIEHIVGTRRWESCREHVQLFGLHARLEHTAIEK